MGKRQPEEGKTLKGATLIVRNTEECNLEKVQHEMIITWAKNIRIQETHATGKALNKKNEKYIINKKNIYIYVYTLFLYKRI